MGTGQPPSRLRWLHAGRLPANTEEEAVILESRTRTLVLLESSLWYGEVTRLGHLSTERVRTNRLFEAENGEKIRILPNADGETISWPRRQTCANQRARRFGHDGICECSR